MDNLQSIFGPLYRDLNKLFTTEITEFLLSMSLADYQLRWSDDKIAQYIVF